MKLRIALVLGILATSMASAADNTSVKEMQFQPQTTLVEYHGTGLNIDDLPNTGASVIAGRLFVGWDALRVIPVEGADDLILETQSQVKVSGNVPGGHKVLFGALSAESVTENERLVWWSRPTEQSERLYGNREVRTFLYPGEYVIHVAFQYKQGEEPFELMRTIIVQVNGMEGFLDVCTNQYGDVQINLNFSALQTLQSNDVLNWTLEGWGSGATNINVVEDTFWPYVATFMTYSPVAYEEDLAERIWDISFSSNNQNGALYGLYFPPLWELWNCGDGGKG